MISKKFIKGFQLTPRNETKLKKFYKKKYNPSSVIILYGMETRRKGKVGINYEALLIFN
jgi:hypothetical protein